MDHALKCMSSSSSMYAVVYLQIAASTIKNNNKKLNLSLQAGCQEWIVAGGCL